MRGSRTLSARTRRRCTGRRSCSRETATRPRNCSRTPWPRSIRNGPGWPRPTGFGASHDLGAVGATEYITDVSRQRLVAVDPGYNGSSTLYVSEDGGASWSRTAAVSYPELVPTFVDASDGYLVADNGATMYRTSDGGHTLAPSSF